jgi:hypothetical protein
LRAAGVALTTIGEQTCQATLAITLARPPHRIRERVQIFQAKCPILMYAYGRNLSV